MAAEVEQMPIDGIDDYEQYDDQGHDDVVDQDFGALQMFDSNASSAPFSSQIAAGHAPEALMAEDPPSSATKKSKRDKKSKKKRKGSNSRSDEPTAELPALSEEAVAQDDEPIEDANPSAHDENPTNEGADDEIVGTPGSHAGQEEETVIPSTQTKKKRKMSDSADGKRRKKRRTRDAEAEVVASTQEDSDKADAVPSLSQGVDSSQANGVHGHDSQNSPTAGHAGRLDQARQSRRKKGTTKRAVEEDQMDVDAAEEADSYERAKPDHGAANEEEADHADTTAELLAAQLETDPDMTTLAREVWMEHTRSQPNGEDSAAARDGQGAEAELTLPEQSQYPENGLGVYDVPDSPPHAQEPPSTATKKSRSARGKKSKPSYYEQPLEAEDENEEAFGDLPSPSAITPRPRKRKQPSARAAKSAAKAAAAEESAYPAQEAEEGEDADGSRGRQNRMAGYTQGRFTEEELERIRKAVESFRKENNMEQHAVNEMIQAAGGTTAGDAHAQLWVRIFAECPDRHRQKVINITRKKFHNFVARGTWTTEQDAELTRLISIHGTKWSKIAGLINRHPEDVRDRYRNYVVCGENQKKDAWDEEEEARLTQYVIEAMEMIDNMREEQPDREYLRRPYEDLIDWQEISVNMGRTRSRLQCITKWKSLNIKTHGKDKLVSGDPESKVSFRVEKAQRQIGAMEDKEKFRLVLAIRDTSAGRESKIPWQRLCDKAFRAKWHRPTQILLWKRLKETIPGWEEKSVRDCAQALVEYYNQHGELPDVVEGTYDAVEEMETVQKLTAGSSRPSGSQRTKGNRSAEFVMDSDAEDEHQEKTEEGQQQEQQEQNGDEAMNDADELLKIDPALMAQPPSAQKSTSSPALRSPSKEAALFRKTPRKGARAVPDPIEDDEAAALRHVGQHVEDDVMADLQAEAAPEAVMHADPLPGELSDSVMDDMDDVPARIMA